MIKSLEFQINQVKARVLDPCSSFILDLLFPSFCVNCGSEKDRAWLCTSCEQKIVPVVSQVCPNCGKLSPGGLYHKSCRRDKYLRGIISSAYFEEGPIREMIHNFKYNGVTQLAVPLAELMIEALKKSEIRMSKSETKGGNLRRGKSIQNKNSQFNIRDSDFILTFVPLHWRRRANRGYNQAEILARNIGESLGVEVIDLLKKPKKTNRQAELSGKSRRKNLKDVFILKANIDIQNKKIIIVDDVTTTGSTLNECARVLKTAGAQEIWGLVVARG